ncbi:DUF3556 domain-containing protein [Nitriliruptor alkaliphilus]|uniref:DUF3556 domain-containing protein n=1 Tax=Nitriliruptor alkaliphilus TaxID=427918 RepID=UPI0006982062|nr:DUF3556 domain-containing protein [Nitriliruptor alkaliphilus]
MGFKEGDFPPVDPGPFLEKPLFERTKTLALHWVEYGFGSPKMIPTTYVVKVVLVYLIAGTAIATHSSGVGPFWDIGGWWDQPIVWQKLVLWTVLLEAIGIAGSWGPIAGKFKPMTGGVVFWARPGTIRLRPWKRVPFTDGNRRTGLDVVLYLGLLVSLLIAVVSPGQMGAGLDVARPEVSSGLVPPVLVVASIVLLVLCGLRDKTIFLAARGEQYLPAMIFFTSLGFVDMIVAAKLLIAIVWIGAGISKFGYHFTHVVAPMVSNSPCVPSCALKRASYRDFPRDIRPSRSASLLAHVGGSAVEIVTPLVLLFSTDTRLTLAAVALMVVFHLFITSTFPLAVPLEWNILFGYLTVFLFIGHPNADGFAVWNISSPLLGVAIVAGLVFFPILGNLRPDLVSFLPSMRQYAGNWASALWAFAPGAEAKLNTIPHRPTVNQVDQLQAMGYPPEVAEITMQQTIAWRSMHSQGRGLFSVLAARLPDLEERTVREAEFACNSLIGFNFGDGHLHDEDLIAAVQERVGFAPGEWIIVWVESQPIHKRTQSYKVIDAALGVIERGTWKVEDAVDAQPWLPDGPIDLDVTWRAAGPAADAASAAGGGEGDATAGSDVPSPAAR